ncbi:bacteriocin immunity protein [Clostridium massiliamazoniense]|uniref:bacteriocin immunity protein n=1 Tax=Clostridium massiliamazoniense TaxID=1347366 RepID=UPI000B238584|nr:bacteriocin immunity protein [Clostridium massiliamazoniense]
MNRKEKQCLSKNILLERIYDLILDKQTAEDERIKLIEFKNAVEKGKDFELQTMRLAENLRRLALYKFRNKKILVLKSVNFTWIFFQLGFLKKN